MPTKLSIFNDALSHLGEARLANLTENREARHTLDDSWNGRVHFCLERAFWNFAMRSVELAASSTFEPAFGLTHVFEKPADWVRTYQVSDNGRFEPQLAAFIDEAGRWHADINPLFVRYVSDDNAYGFDLGQWPQSFAECVSAALALHNCYRLTGSDSRAERLERLLKRNIALARGNDAMNEPPVSLPLNSWVRSRGDGANRDR
jgi:hypothetical protein